MNLNAINFAPQNLLDAIEVWEKVNYLSTAIINIFEIDASYYT